MYTIDDPSLAEHERGASAGGFVGLLSLPYHSGEFTDGVFSLNDEELYANALVLLVLSGMVAGMLPSPEREGTEKEMATEGIEVTEARRYTVEDRLALNAGEPGAGRPPRGVSGAAL